MAGKKKQTNARRKARFQSQPARTEANKRRRWEKQQKKMAKKAEKRGEKYVPKFKSYEEEKSANQASGNRRRAA